MQSPIAQAVAPLRADAETAAAAAMRRYLDKLLAELQAAGWDAKIAAPRPHGRMDRAAYRAAQAKCELIAAITAPAAEGCRSMQAPDLRIANAAGVEKIVQRAVEEAGASFEAFVAKLQTKVGEHTAATLVAGHTWGFSILRVSTPAGEQQWKTQQIVNVSSLGKLFNQWPTRPMK